MFPISIFLASGLRRAKTVVSDTFFADENYFRWENKLRTSEAFAIAINTDLKGHKVLSFLNRSGAIDFFLRKSIYDARMLELSLKLPESDNLVSKRIPKLQAFRAKHRSSSMTGVRFLENPNSPYFGFFTKDEIHLIKVLLITPLQEADESHVIDICLEIIEDRAYIRKTA